MSRSESVQLIHHKSDHLPYATNNLSLKDIWASAEPLDIDRMSAFQEALAPEPDLIGARSVAYGYV